jgi:hypothetical protein
VSGFSAQWLALREPLDSAARSEALCTSLVNHLARRPPDSSLSVIDLGAGTGANFRYAARRLSGPQEWLLIDHDASLLAAADAQLAAHGAPEDCRMRHLQLDLATGLARLALPVGGLVTASALLDLVSKPWLIELIGRAAAARVTVWIALTYDGRIDCQPLEPEDAQVRELFNRHQHTDKGFGPALGPEAARVAERLLAEHGYQVERATSDWCLGPEHAALQRALVEGWCNAACEMAPQHTEALRHWLGRRLAHIEVGRSQLQVGHVDMIGRCLQDRRIIGLPN